MQEERAEELAQEYVRRLSRNQWPFPGPDSGANHDAAWNSLQHALRDLVPESVTAAAVVQSGDIKTRMVLALAGGALFTLRPVQPDEDSPIQCVTRRLPLDSSRDTVSVTSSVRTRVGEPARPTTWTFTIAGD